MIVPWQLGAIYIQLLSFRWLKGYHKLDFLYTLTFCFRMEPKCCSLYNKVSGLFCFLRSTSPGRFWPSISYFYFVIETGNEIAVCSDIERYIYICLGIWTSHNVPGPLLSILMGMKVRSKGVFILVIYSLFLNWGIFYRPDKWGYVSMPPTG